MLRRTPMKRTRRKAPTAVETMADRFWSKVDKGAADECWPWLSTRIPKGYGQFWLEGRNRPATHIALVVSGRDQPSDAPLALHSCDNPPCVNPFHLRWGTPGENMDDRSIRLRSNPRRGASHQNSKISEAQMLAIRSDPRPQKTIAAEYGLAQSNVSRIKSHTRWCGIK